MSLKTFHGKGSLPNPDIHNRGTGDMYMAVIKAVNPETNTFSISPVLTESTTGEVRNDLTFAFPSLGTSSGMMHYPEVGSLVLMGFANGFLVPLSYLPSAPDVSPMYFTTSNDSMPADSPVKTIRHKFPIIRVGDLHFFSKDGPTLALDDEVNLNDGFGQSLRIRPATKTATLSAATIQNKSVGVSIKEGHASRLYLPDMDDEESPTPGRFVFPTTNIDGSKYWSMGAPLSLTSTPASEYRLEVDYLSSLSELGLDGIDEFGSVNTLAFNPKRFNVEYVVGNYIGNTLNKKEEYGVFLRPRIFDNKLGARSFHAFPDYFFRPLAQAGDINTKGVAYGHRVDLTYFQVMDKSGGWHEYLGRSPEGVSRETFAEGDQIQVFKGFSDFAYVGGYREIASDIGDKFETNSVSWSKYLTSVGRVFEEIGTQEGVGAVKKSNGEDYSVDELRSFSKVSNVARSVRTSIGGSEEYSALSRAVRLRSSYTLDASSIALDSQGAMKLAASSMVVLSSSMGTIFQKSVNYESSFANGGKTTITLGDIEREVLVGRDITKVRAGAIDQSVNAGTISQTITAGSASRKVSAGTITDEVVAGQASYKATRVSIEGTAQVNVTSSVNVTIAAPTIILGDATSGVPFPVLTVGNHFCNVTGALPIPGLNGSKVVYAV